MTYELFPVSLFLVLRGQLTQDQLLVPYVGAGWTRLHYRESIKGQEKREGAINGSYLRAGIQFLLDSIDTRAATTLKTNYGVENSYLFVEIQKMNAKVKSTSIELGGEAILGGVLFEF